MPFRPLTSTAPAPGPTPGFRPIGQPPAAPGIVDRFNAGIEDARANRAGEITRAADANASGEQGKFRSLFQIGGQLVGSAIDPIVEGVKAVAPAVLKTDKIKKDLGTLFKPVAKSIDKLGGTKFFREAADASPELPIERDLKAVVEYLNLAPGPKVAGGINRVLPKAIDAGVDTVAKLTARSEQQIESAIVKKFEKGVKPLLPGKTTPAKLDRYRDDVVTAVKVIKENKPNLSFTDDVEGVVTGQDPRSLQHLAEAVEQTKKAVFTKYDGLAKTAGEAGVAVDMKPIASELQTVIGNRALAITNPRAIQYAESLSERLTAAGKLDASTAQEVIQNYNKSLEAFYRNPSYDTASQAAIDAMVANRMRTALDDGISGLTGEQYAVLKAQYGALKSIEKDVIKASLRDARKGVKGLIDFSDIFSGGQVVNGILTLNPAQIASGLTQKGIAEFYKYLNNPNRAIEQMFKAADSLPSVGKLK